MMSRGLTITTAVLLVRAVSWAAAPTASEAFLRGNDAYRTGQFQQAAVEYEGILKQGVASAEIYFNLGNTYYRMGRLAQSIVAYERALRLHPNDPDIRYNLRLVNLRTADRIEPVPELFLVQWLRVLASLLPGAATASVLVDVWIIFFLALAVMYLFDKPMVLRIARVALILSGVFLILVAAMFSLQQSQLNARDSAIILEPVVTSKSSPDEQSVDAFVIHEGLKVRLSDAVGDWVKITLPDGKVGWVKMKQAERI